MTSGEWAIWIQSLPDNPNPEEFDTRIPTMGVPDKELLKLLDRKGYKHIDCRLLKPSEQMVELIIKGAEIGTIELTQNQVALLRAESQRLGLFDKDRKRKKDGTTFKDLEALRGDLGKSLKAPPKRVDQGRKPSKATPGPGRDSQEPLVAAARDAQIAAVVSELELDKFLGGLDGE